VEYSLFDTRAHIPVQIQEAAVSVVRLRGNGTDHKELWLYEKDELHEQRVSVFSPACCLDSHARDQRA
jgi:hypothetical protein